MTRGCLSLTDGPSLAERPCPQQDRPGGLCCTTTLPLLASALAVQPWSVLAPVLLVTAEGGVAKTMAYVAGWVLALAATALATVSLYPETPKVASSSQWVTWVQLAAGVALGGWLLVGMRRPVAATSDAQGRGTQPLSSQPKWTARLESMTPPPAFAFASIPAEPRDRGPSHRQRGAGRAVPRVGHGSPDDIHHRCLRRSFGPLVGAGFRSAGRPGDIESGTSAGRGWPPASDRRARGGRSRSHHQWHRRAGHLTKPTTCHSASLSPRREPGSGRAESPPRRPGTVSPDRRRPCGGRTRGSAG